MFLVYRRCFCFVVFTFVGVRSHLTDLEGWKTEGRRQTEIWLFSQSRWVSWRWSRNRSKWGRTPSACFSFPHECTSNVLLARNFHEQLRVSTCVDLQSPPFSHLETLTVTNSFSTLNPLLFPSALGENKNRIYFKCYVTLFKCNLL